ncbi:MAG TPA: hypothetical protein PKL77_00940 [Candidatus Omnitrophota bacterium]|nr:hypothetical protein [Candidatus Omnitrophota bacterium]
MKRIGMTIFFLLWAAAALALDADLWEAPQLPGSTLIYKDKPVEIMHIKAQVTHLRTKVLQNDIFSFYQGELEKIGWQPQKMLTDMITAFSKENRYFYVGVVGGYADQEVYLVSSPESLSICPYIKQYILRSELAADAPGKDVTDIPRFPTSKRRLDILGPGSGAVLLYETTASPSEVIQFYRRAMPESGWHELRSFTQSVLEKMNVVMPDYAFSMFDKDANQALIGIFRVPDKLLQHADDFPKGRTLIFITRNVEQEFPMKGGGEE